MSRSDRPLSSHGRVLIGVSWYRMSAPPDGTLRVVVRNIRFEKGGVTSTAWSRRHSGNLLAHGGVPSLARTRRGSSPVGRWPASVRAPDAGALREPSPLRQTNDRGPDGAPPTRRRGA